MNELYAKSMGCLVTTGSHKGKVQLSNIIRESSDVRYGILN